MVHYKARTAPACGAHSVGMSIDLARVTCPGCRDWVCGVDKGVSMAQMRKCVADCSIRIPVGKIMCEAHWAMVKPALRDDLVKHYVPGSYTQFDPNAKSKFTIEWLTAVKAAVAAVNAHVG